MVKRFIPRAVKQYLKGVSGLTRLEGENQDTHRRIAELEARVRELAEGLAGAQQGVGNLHGTLHGLWRQSNIWEAVVGLAFRDLCRPGMVAFDCGANMGQLSILLSRLVGPRGVVCAFEASPRVVDICQQNLVMNGCHNVTLYHAAVFSRPNELIPIYFSNHLQGDSIIEANAGDRGRCCPVPTVALDEFVQRTGIVPDLVKMDIEGAEFEAVSGMAATIKLAKPHLILETQADDERCLHWLRAAGYRAIDLNTYREVRSRADYPPGVIIRNLLYVHEDRLEQTGYRLPFRFVEAGRVTLADCERLPDGSLRQREELHLPRGRYTIDVRATAEREDNEMLCGVKSGEKPLVLFQSSTQHTFQSYRDWIIDLPAPAPVRIFFEFRGGTTDPSFRFTEAPIRRIAEFDCCPVQLVN